MAAVAVIGFEIDANRKSVRDVAGTEFSRSAIPNPADHSYLPSLTTATDAPGKPFAAMNFDTASSICLRWSGAGSCVAGGKCDKVTGAKTSKTNTRHADQATAPAQREKTVLTRYTQSPSQNR